MPNALLQTLPYALIPVLATITGGIVAAFRPPGPWLRSMTQHFAAGVVFAAVAGELVPGMTHDREPLPAIIGFALGVATMLVVRRLSQRLEKPGIPVTALPIGLIITVAIDILIDGLLVGIGFAAGSETGLLVMVALTMELLFLGLSTASELGQAGASRGRIVAVTSGLALLVLVGAALGGFLLAGLTGSMLIAVLGFGVAALLYLVTEELLVEAHEVPETTTTTAAFFLGFLLLLVIEMVA